MTIVWDDDVTLLDAAHMNQLEQITRKAQPNGYASLGADGLVPPAQLPPAAPLVITDPDIPDSITRDTELAAGLATKADSAAVAAADVLKVDKDSVVVAATRLVASKLLAGDAQPAFSVLGDGRHQWGAGGAAASDVLLYRESAGRLRTNGFFRAWDTIIGAIGPSSATGIRFLDTDIYRGGPQLLQTDTAFVVGGDMVVNNQGGSKLYFGSQLDLDTTLYRFQAGVLATDGQFIAKSHGSFNWNTANEVHLGHNGGAIAPAIYFGNAADTNLYRAGATVLKTDGVLYVGSNVVAKQGLAQQVFIGDLGDTVPSLAFGLDTAVTFRRYGNDLSFFGSKFQFGGAFDTNLYRSAASELKTDGNLYAGGQIIANQGTAAQFQLGNDGKLYFGNAFDTALYRDQATVLRTAGQLWANSFLAANKGTANEVTVGHKGDAAAAGFYFGNTGDTNLYRFGAGYLKSDSNVLVGGTLAVDHNNVGGKLYFGSGTDASLYRSAANTLETPGTFNMGAMGINVPGVGGRGVVFGAPDTAGVGFRVMAVAN